MADPPFTVFLKDNVSLCSYPKFLSKMSKFHINQVIHLWFFPQSHISPQRNPFYRLRMLGRCQPFIWTELRLRKSPSWFATVADRCKGSVISTQRLSRQISDYVILCMTLQTYSLLLGCWPISKDLHQWHYSRVFLLQKFVRLSLRLPYTPFQAQCSSPDLQFRCCHWKCTIVFSLGLGSEAPVSR